MFTSAHTRKPACLLARGRVRLRLCVRADAFGNALGNSIGDTIRESQQEAARNKAMYSLSNGDGNGVPGMGGGTGITLGGGNGPGMRMGGLQARQLVQDEQLVTNGGGGGDDTSIVSDTYESDESSGFGDIRDGAQLAAGADKLKLRSVGNPTAENRIARSRSLADAQARIAAMEKNIADLQAIKTNSLDVDKMGQPLNGRSNYNAFSKFGEIAGGFPNDPLGTLGKLADWATYTVPDAQQRAAEINAQYGQTQDPFLQRLDKMAASPLGSIFSLGTRWVGGDQAAQDAMLNIGTAADGLGMAAVGLAGRAPAFTGAQRPSMLETRSPYALTSLDNLAGRSSTDRMQMGIRFETVQGTLDNYSLYGGRSVTQLYVRAFDGNGGLVPGSVRLDRVGLQASGVYDLIDYKLSANSPVTWNQGLHYPALAKNGGIVTGLRGDPIDLPRGTVIPPSPVRIQPGPTPKIFGR